MGKKIQVLLIFQNVFSWLRDEDPVDRGRSWLWIWGDCLEKPGLGAVAMGGGSCVWGRSPTLLTLGWWNGLGLSCRRLLLGVRPVL